MTPVQREHLSAGMDGELSADELRFLLRRLEHDADARQAWARYHLIRDGLRRQACPPADAGFADAVMAQIRVEADSARTLPHWLRWSAGGAIAAGVAVAALMSVHPGAGSAPGNATPGENPIVASADPMDRSPTTDDRLQQEPAAVPPWLLQGDNQAAQYSQRASAVLGEPGEQRYLRNSVVSPWRRAGEGGYLLLIDAPQAAAYASAPVVRSAH